MNSRTLLSMAVVLAISSMAGCSGDNGTGSSGGNATPLTGAKVTGVITAMNTPVATGVMTGIAAEATQTITVRDVAYVLDDDVTIEVEDSPGDASDLALGRVVTLSTATDEDGNNLATTIAFEDELEGVVFDAFANDALIVMGQNVMVNESTRFESDVDGIGTLQDIAAGNVVEVDGHPTDDGIVATRIEVKAGDYLAYEEFELKGTITAANEDGGTIVIGGQTILIGANTQVDDMPDWDRWTGLYVEVKANPAGIDPGARTITATEVEIEDLESEGDDGDEAEMEGVLVYADGVYSVGGQTVAPASGVSTELFDSLRGKLVEVEGIYVSGILLVQHIELED